MLLVEVDLLIRLFDALCLLFILVLQHLELLHQSFLGAAERSALLWLLRGIFLEIVLDEVDQSLVFGHHFLFLRNHDCQLFSLLLVLLFLHAQASLQVNQLVLEQLQLLQLAFLVLLLDLQLRNLPVKRKDRFIVLEQHLLELGNFILVALNFLLVELIKLEVVDHLQLVILNISLQVNH